MNPFEAIETPDNFYEIARFIGFTGNLGVGQHIDGEVVSPELRYCRVIAIGRIGVL